MTKQKLILSSLLFMFCVAGLLWLAKSPGNVMARAERKDARGNPYTITVRSFGRRYSTELAFGDLHYPISSYFFGESSSDITNAVITWDELGKFGVAFDDGDIIIRCSWSDAGAHWERDSRWK